MYCQVFTYTLLIDNKPDGTIKLGVPGEHNVYNSLAAFMAIKRSKLARKQKGWAWGTGILTVLIILATVFLKQHSMFDGVCALALYVVTDKLCYGVNPETERSKVRNQLI